MEDECRSTELLETEDTELIRGLPNDITLYCLARVPRKYHTVLKCVSRRWRELVCSEEWHDYRRKNNLAETWIYALCRSDFDHLRFYVLDPNSRRRCWKLIPMVPDNCLKRKGMGFEAFGKKIYLMGGCGWSEDTNDEVYCYDVPRNSWTEVTSLATARCYFACKVLDGKIHAIGGLGSNPSDIHSWDCFDPHKSTCESHPYINIFSEIDDSVVLDGKIYTRCGAYGLASHIYGVVYDPSRDTWQHADADLVSGWRGPAVVVDGNFYVLDESVGTRLMMWDKLNRDWVAVGRLSPLLTRPPCRLAVIGKRIFIVGKGLSTVIVDIGQTGNNMDGVMVSSSIPGLDSQDEIISCTCVSI